MGTRTKAAVGNFKVLPLNFPTGSKGNKETHNLHNRSYDQDSNWAYSENRSTECCHYADLVCRYGKVWTKPEFRNMLDVK
jgi:uncharacterized cupin superfamily protein